MTITSRRGRCAAGAAAMLALACTTAATAEAASVVAVAAAPAGQATTTGDAIIAVATGQAIPKPADRNSNASIIASITEARALAIPRALINAQVQAAQIATATGLTLGPVTQVSQDTLSGLYAYSFNQQIFKLGPNRYCGPVQKRIVRRVKGKRVVLTRTTKQCYVPPFIATTLSVTFSATRAS
ncbi:MAG: hypothetical protein ABL886_16165 [Rhodoglobus sp.]